MSSDSGQTVQERLFRQVTLGDLAAIRHYVRQAAEAGGLDGTALEELVVAANEALSNIIRHGFKGQPADISVTIACSPEAVEVTLRDQGPAFDPHDAPPPDTSLPLEQRPFGGLGVQLMRELCDEMRYRREAGSGNELRLLKKTSHSE